MTLATGTKLGPYEILAPIGAGGMGEVYRARDERLKRDVAVKVLPATYSADAERLRRFEQEAQAAGALNHPNITAVHDFGTSSDGSPYIVTELLEGETLRGRLSGGALSVRKATDYAIQAAKGLAAAHEKGIVHRDLKPENLFVTSDGRIKILDFGLAKLTQADGATGPQTNLPTAAGTEPGVVMGTLGYMSPEQVKGKAADARSDIFSFGAILYEMLSGSRAFHRDTAAETMSAILREEPPDLSATNKSVQPGLERVVRHCLEKSPEERFHSAHDLAFDLEAISGTSASAITARPAVASRFRPLPLLAGALAAAALLAAGFFFGKAKGVSDPPTFKQLTFRKGAIWGARFGSDGKSILTTASWDGKPAEIYISRPESPESVSFGLPGAEVAAVSSTGDIAVILRADFDTAFTRAGTLARVGATGGAPRELLEKVQFADWSPNGKDLLIVRPVEGKIRLEYPQGKVLYETTGWIGNPRVSHDGTQIAFLDHPAINDDGGSVAVIDLEGKKTTLSPMYATSNGLAWSPSGSEIWYTAAEVGGNRILHAASLSGKTRALARVAGSLTLRDVTRDGRVLIAHDIAQMGLVARGPADAKEVDLSWLDWSLLGDISPDGRFVVFTETGEGGGRGYSVYLRALDGSPAIRLGEGSAQSISPDGKSVLAFLGPQDAPEFVIYPTGAGEPRKVGNGGVAARTARWLPDGRRFLVVGSEKGKPPRTYIFDPEGSAPKPLVAAEGYRGALISPDGKRVAMRGPKGLGYLYPLEGGEPKAFPNSELSDTINYVGWVSNEALLYRKGSSTSLPVQLFTHDVVSGRQEPWGEIMPVDATGVNSIVSIRFSPSGAYAYSYARNLSSLFLVEGVK